MKTKLKIVSIGMIFAILFSSCSQRTYDPLRSKDNYKEKKRIQADLNF